MVGRDQETCQLSFEIVDGPEDGKLGPIDNSPCEQGTQNDPNRDTASVRYRPDDDWNGTDGFTYRVSDGQDTSPDADVDVKVKPIPESEQPQDPTGDAGGGGGLKNLSIKALCSGKGAGANHVLGTSGPDRLVGTNGVDVLCGFDGNDVIVGADANDILAGGSGADRLRGGSGMISWSAGKVATS